MLPVDYPFWSLGELSWGMLDLLPKDIFSQVVNVPSFIVRLDSQKHIDFSLKSPFGGKI